MKRSIFREGRGKKEKLRSGRIAENSFFSMRRFLALLELCELLLRVGDVGLVRAAELKELPLATKIQLRRIELGLVIFRFRCLSGGARLGKCGSRLIYFRLTRLAGQKTRLQALDNPRNNERRLSR